MASTSPICCIPFFTSSPGGSPKKTGHTICSFALPHVKYNEEPTSTEFAGGRSEVWLGKPGNFGAHATNNNAPDLSSSLHEEPRIDDPSSFSISSSSISSSSSSSDNFAIDNEEDEEKGSDDGGWSSATMGGGLGVSRRPDDRGGGSVSSISSCTDNDIDKPATAAPTAAPAAAPAVPPAVVHSAGPPAASPGPAAAAVAAAGEDPGDEAADCKLVSIFCGLMVLFIAGVVGLPNLLHRVFPDRYSFSEFAIACAVGTIVGLFVVIQVLLIKGVIGANAARRLRVFFRNMFKLAMLPFGGSTGIDELFGGSTGIDEAFG